MTLRAVDYKGHVPAREDLASTSREPHENLTSIRESLGRIFDELASIGRQIADLEAAE